VFEGFLPRKGAARTERLAALAREERTTVLYEAPHRVARTLADLATACGGARRIAVARELTKLHEEVWRGTLDEAVEWASGDAPRGELVLTLDGAAPAAAKCRAFDPPRSGDLHETAKNTRERHDGIRDLGSGRHIRGAPPGRYRWASASGDSGRVRTGPAGGFRISVTGHTGSYAIVAAGKLFS
jgi:hypothetical protein